jgi:hypothetical protein
MMSFFIQSYSSIGLAGRVIAAVSLQTKAMPVLLATLHDWLNSPRSKDGLVIANPVWPIHVQSALRPATLTYHAR